MWNNFEYMHNNFEQYLTIILISGVLVTNVIVLYMVYIAYTHYKHYKNVVYKFIQYIRPLYLYGIRMNCEELLDECLDNNTDRCVNVNNDRCVNDTPGHTDNGHNDKKRERLAVLVLGGQSRQYLGKNVSAEEIDNMSSQEIEKLYTRYEARLGASVTKTLVRTAVQLYATVAGIFLPIPHENIPMLTTDLETDQFVSRAMNTAACDLYYKFGFYLAPLIAIMITAKYCRKNDNQFRVISEELNKDGRTDNGTTRTRGESDC